MSLIFILALISILINYRYAFAIIANLTVFGVFWGLLDKINHSVAAADLTPDDKLIFWVSVLYIYTVEPL